MLTADDVRRLSVRSILIRCICVIFVVCLMTQSSFGAGKVKVEKRVPQESVVTGYKKHSLFLTIHLYTNASVKDCVLVVRNMKNYVKVINPPQWRNASNEIWFGVGFGFDFYEKVLPDLTSRGVEYFRFRARTGKFGTMPATGGDIFVHAKSDDRGGLFELAHAIILSMPIGAVRRFEDVYGWTYDDQEELGSFIYGIDQSSEADDGSKVAISPDTGGSYAFNQKWDHNFTSIRTSSPEIFNTTYLLPEVRQTQTYGTLSGLAGIMFMAYAASTQAFDSMLDNIIEIGKSRSDFDLSLLTRCVASNYWYFPSQTELDTLL